MISDQIALHSVQLPLLISDYPVLFTDSPPVPPSERRQVREITSKMASRFAAVTNEEISQIIIQAFPDMHEEGEKIRCGSFDR